MHPQLNLSLALQVESWEFGEVLLDLPKLLNLTEGGGEMGLDAPTAPDHKKGIAETCAPRSRGGRFLVRVSTEEALDSWPIPFTNLRFPMKLPPSSLCWFGSPWLEKFLLHDLWHLLDLDPDQRTNYWGGHHWRCWRIKIDIAYTPLFFHKEVITKELNHKDGHALFEEHYNAGFAFLFAGKPGFIRRFNLGVFVVSLTALSWLVGMPTKICNYLAVYAPCVPGRDVYRAVLFKHFDIQNEILGWMVRSVTTADALKKFSQKDGETVEVESLMQELLTTFQKDQEAEEVIDHISQFLIHELEERDLSNWVKRVQSTEVINTTHLREWDHDAFHSVKEIWKDVRKKSFQCVSEISSDAGPSEESAEATYTSLPMDDRRGLGVARSFEVAPSSRSQRVSDGPSRR